MKRTLALGALCALLAGAAPTAHAQRMSASVQAAASEPYALLIPYIPRPGQANQGFFSFENYGTTKASASVSLYDEHGTAVATADVSLPPGVTRWVNAVDLIRGNASKGISVTPQGTARSPSLWARVQPGERVQVFAYVRSRAGFVTAMSRTAANVKTRDGRRAALLPFFNPGSNTSVRSELRLVNPTDQNRTVLIGAWDSSGEKGEGVIQCELPAYAVVRLTSAELETGPSHSACTRERWGDGAGKWFVQVEDKELHDEPLVAVSILHSTATGLLTNVSAPALTVIGEAGVPPADLAPADDAAFFARVNGKKVLVSIDGGGASADYRFSGEYLGCNLCSGHGRFTVRFSTGDTEDGHWRYTKGAMHQGVLALEYGPLGFTGTCNPVTLLFTSPNAGRLSSVCTGDITGGDGTFEITSIF